MKVSPELPAGPAVGKPRGALDREAADHVRLAGVEGEGAPVGLDRNEPAPRPQYADELGHDRPRRRVDRVERAVRQVECGRVADLERERRKPGRPEPLCHVTISRLASSPSTEPSGPTRSANRQASNLTPEPAPSTRMPGESPRASRFRSFDALTQGRSLTYRR